MYIGLGQIRASVTSPIKMRNTAPTFPSSSTQSVVPSIVRLDQPIKPLSLQTIQALPKPLALMPGVKTLTPTKGGGTVVDFRAQVEAAKDPLKPAGMLPTGGGGGSSPPSTQDPFTKACVAEGGFVAGNLCNLPDGAVIAWENGRPVCKNTAGMCAQGGGGNTAVIVGAAALAALMFLR